MILYIVRHGETDWNLAHKVQGQTDICLNDYGRHLAEETARGMKKIPIDLGYTSPLKRARETAEIILGDRDIPLIDDPRIREISFGSYEGIISGGGDERSRAFSRFFTDTANYEAPRDGESIRMLYDRTGDFLADLMSRRELADKSILVSTHGAAMTAILNRIKGNLTVDHFWRDEVPPNCSVTKVEVSGGSARIAEEGMIFYKEKVKKWKTV
ncbi:MAG TPA: histidine phosphatase family protein [Candidatus Mediterraneibacter colneyensis]|nr:histidine phosphatase family protein [Candidatus Mediterraneibacter colneyensis]